jgi:hypothetical protein
MGFATDSAIDSATDIATAIRKNYGCADASTNERM